MFSTVQKDFLAEIVSQYDYYTAYYYGSYHDYTVGEIRDNKILVYCSDHAPSVEGTSFNYTDCTLYEVTSNKYILREHFDTVDFTPIADNDIVYTNAVSGFPQFDFYKSVVRSEASEYVMYGTLIVFCCAICIRLLFGR